MPLSYSTAEDLLTLMILAFPVLVVVAAETSRLVWLRDTVGRFKQPNSADADNLETQSLPFAVRSFAILGRYASVATGQGNEHLEYDTKILI